MKEIDEGELIMNEKDELKEIELKYLFDNLKNDFFLIKIFDNMQRKKTLEIVKCNKRIQKRLNININDYKEFCETCTPIEIEIIPAKGKYGKFINLKAEDELFLMNILMTLRQKRMKII